MIGVNINFHQRVALWLRVGSYNVPSLRDAALFIRVIEKIRPREHEIKETKFTQADGRIEYLMPDPGYGTESYVFEDEEIKKVIECLHNHHQPFRIDEAAWILALIEDIETQLKVSA